MGQQLGLTFSDFRKLILKGFCNACVKRASRLAKQCAVGCVLYERVLEQVARVRRHTLLGQQACLLKTLKRRSELIPNLVETVKGYAGHERGVLDEVTRLRGAARALPENDVASRAQAETALSQALGKLVALAENYPDLKASANFLQLQQQLSQLETELQMARRYYNGTVRNQNVLVQSFPSNLIANSFGFEQRQYFEVSDEADRAVPQVSLQPPSPAR